MLVTGEEVASAMPCPYLCASCIAGLVFLAFLFVR